MLDGEGNRLAGKYYGDFLKKSGINSTTTTSNTSKSDGKPLKQEDVRANFERTVQSKIGTIAARGDAPEVATVQGRTAVFCGGAGSNDPANAVRVVHIGPPGESELVLAHLVEGVYDALQILMGGAVDRGMVLDNLELVFLLIDEHCDGGIILETNGSKLASAVLLRDADEAEDLPSSNGQQQPQYASAAQGGNNLAAQRGLPPGVQPGDMTLGQAFRQAKQQIFSNLTSRDGM